MGGKHTYNMCRIHNNYYYLISYKQVTLCNEIENVNANKEGIIANQEQKDKQYRQSFICNNKDEK